MTGRDLLWSLSQADGALIVAAAYEMPRRRWKKGLLLASCLAVVLVVTAAAEMLGLVDLTELFTSREESGYRIEAELEPFAQRDFSPSVAEELRARWGAWDALSPEVRLASSQSPWSGWKDFADWRGAVGYLGIPLTNPLEEATWLSLAGSSAVAGLEESHCRVWVYGDRDGNVQQAVIQSGYLAGEVRVTLRATVYTEESGEFSTGSAWAEWIEFQTGTYRDAVVVTPQGTEKYASVRAYLVRDNALYDLGVVGPKGEEDLARETLEQALDRFQ